MPTKPKRKPSYKKVVEEYTAGHSIFWIAKQYRVPYWEVETMIRRAMKE